MNARSIARSWRVPLSAVSLLVLLTPGSPVCGQTGAATRPGVGTDSTHFLWYSGHWSKTKKNVFIIRGNAGSNGSPGEEPGNSGGTLTIGDDGSIQMNSAAIDDWNKWVDQAQKTADQTVQLLNNPADNMDPATHTLYEMMKADADSQKVQVAKLKVQPKEDLLSTGLNDVPLRNDQVADYCRQVKSTYEEVINFYRTQIKDHENDLRVPPPPQFDNDCVVCDSSLRNEYLKRANQYLVDFPKPEEPILHKGLSILHKLAISGLLTNEAVLYNTEGCSYLDVQSLSNVLYRIMDHLCKRADKLVEDNISNSKAAETIFRVYVSIYKGWELIQGNPKKLMLGEIADLFGKEAEYYLKELEHDDWRQIGNLPYILTIARQNALMGGQGDLSYLAKLQEVLNGFELSLEMDIKIGNSSAYKLAHLKGKCHIVPEFTGDQNQCYTWVVADEGDLGALGVFRKKRMQTIDCQVIANELITPPQAPKITYTGTRKYTAGLKGLRMDFCHPGHDTIFLTGFTPNPVDAGVWTIPSAGLQNLGVNGMEEFFESIDEKQEEAQSGDARQLVKELEQKELELQAQMKAIQDAQAAAKASKANGHSSQEKILELSDQSQSVTTSPGLAKVLYLDFLLPVQSKNSVLVDKKYLAKEINPDKASAIIYGTYTVHIENNANGKTKPIPPPK